MDRLTGKDAQLMMEALASVYVKEEVDQEVISEEVDQEVISEEVAETEELQENQANRAKQQRLRQQQNAGRAEQQFGALKPKPRTGSFQDRRFARRSSSAAARANTNRVGQNIKVGSPTGPAQNDQLKKPTPTVMANKAPAQSPTSNLKPGNPNVVVSPKSGEETKFERRLPSMAELRAAQAARKAAAAGGASKQEAEYQAVKAGVNAGKPAPKPAAAGPGGYKVSAAATPKLGGSIPLSQKAKMQDLSKKDTGSFFDGAKGGKYDTSAKPAAAAPTPPPAVKKKPAPGARNRMRMEELDVFDTIKEYLIGEGATEEEALKQMLTLTDEQRTEIIEGSCGSKKKKKSKKGGY